MKVRVAITGTLSRPRKEIIQLIQTKTNAVYHSSVDPTTDYLVASRRDTAKAQAASECGVEVLTEAELFGYIEAGHIPPRLAYRQADLRNPEESKAFLQKITRLLPFVPAEPKRGEWDIVWSEILDPSLTVALEYEDFDGTHSERTATVSQRGKRPDGTLYWGATDDERFKTFREDRIVDFRLADGVSCLQKPILRQPNPSLLARFRRLFTSTRF
jgi:hypothetical protein